MAGRARPASATSRANTVMVSPSGLAWSRVTSSSCSVSTGRGWHTRRACRDSLRCVPVDLSAPEIRVLGCLLEKQRTTPDAYPLSLNALRLACNQSTNRDPVTDYDEAVIRDALHRLSRRRWARLASGAGSRAPKYRHLLDEALGLPEDELAVLCVLMLRGAADAGRAQAAHRAPAPIGRPRRPCSARSSG